LSLGLIHKGGRMQNIFNIFVLSSLAILTGAAYKALSKEPPELKELQLHRKADCTRISELERKIEVYYVPTAKVSKPRGK
jgi:hypothetical protein